MKKFWRRVLVPGLVMLTVLVGCAKYNTYYNAKRAFDDAEHVRDEAIRRNEDPPPARGAQKTNYETAIRKAQKVLDEYPGHSLTDDALFLQGKAHFRLESYRQSIRKLDLLFVNFPQTPFLEESYYLQALNYLLLGDVVRSQEYLDRLTKNYPESNFLSETLIVSGDNSYAVEDWQLAAEAYNQYLTEFPESDDRGRIGLKLADCYWEMRQYDEAADVLQQVNQDAVSAELAFRARLLQARVNIKTGDFEVVDLLLNGLKEEAATYNSEGKVRVIEAENLIAQGKGDEATPLLEGLPEEWRTPDIVALAADQLGYLYVERGDWEDALDQFKSAVRRIDDLDDKERTRRLKDNLQDYLSADEGLANASGARVPRLKLLQANAMLFGFERPGEAARLYQEAAADSAADSTVAARGLYGAVIVYRDYLDKPDSAEIFAADLEQLYPESPQAFELSSDGDVNLLQYLLTQQDEERADNYAALSDGERRELTEITTGGEEGAAAAVSAGPGFRRQMIYLSRRPNLAYDPPEVARLMAAERLQVRQSAADEMRTDGPEGDLVTPSVSRAPSGLRLTPSDSTASPPQSVGAVADSLAAGTARGSIGPEQSPLTAGEQADVAADEQPIATDDDQAETEEKEEEKKDWEFDLRAPSPNPGAGP